MSGVMNNNKSNHSFRRRYLAALVVASLWIFGPAAGAWADEPSSARPLVFWNADDVVDVAGSRLIFGAEPLRHGGQATGYPEGAQYGCRVPREDGSQWIYFWRLANWQDPAGRTVEVLRATTKDGLRFENTQTVFREVNPKWQGFVNIVHRPPRNAQSGSLFLFSFSAGSLYVYQSADGAEWKLLTTSAYQEHDACCVIWHPQLNALVNYQHTLQPWPAKRYPDNIGAHRRVISFRRSDDGVKWETFSPPFLDGKRLWTPDDDDPVDLEFYRPAVFGHAGRFAMLLLDYIAPPPEANSRRLVTKHGPRAAAEWAQSRDGLNWRRAHRDLDATEHFTWAAVQGPLVLDRRLRFYSSSGQIAELPHDRIFFVSSRGNGEFSTHPFTMPKAGLRLNAEVLFQPGEGAGRAYLMAALVDERGNPIAGFERAKCLLENVDGRDLPMVWQGADTASLAGRTVRLRFYLRDAKLYGVTTQAAAENAP
jgi:hypothetical protein